MSQHRRVALLIGASYVLVGLPFGLLVLNFDASQLWAVVLAYAVVAPVLSVMLLWRRSTEWEGSRRRLHRLWHSLPGQVATAVPVGHAGAALLLQGITQLPIEECVKFLLTGIPVLIIGVALAYFTLPGGSLGVSPGQVSLKAKFWASLLAVALVAIVSQGLHSYASAQRLLERNAASTVSRRLESLARQIAQGRKWTSLLEFGDYDQFAIIDRHDHAIAQRGPSPGREFLATIRRYAGKSAAGYRLVHRGRTRLVAWRDTLGGDRLVAVVPMSNYAPELEQVVRGSLPGLGLTLLTVTIFGWFLSRSLLQPLARLTRFVSDFPDCSLALLGTHSETDDEVGLLVRNFRLMVQELARAHDSLRASNMKTAKALAERAEKVKQLGCLFEISRMLSSGGPQGRTLGTVLGRACELVDVEVGAVMLLRADRLVTVCAVGTAGAPGPDSVAMDHALAERAFRTSRAITEAVEDQPGDPILEFARAAGGRQVLCVALRDQEWPVGLLVLVQASQRPPDDSACRLVLSIAQQMAFFVRKAAFLEQAEAVSDILRRALTPRNLYFPGLWVGHLYVPSRELSGDYYDVIPLGETRCGIVMADVAGKGPPAAAYAVQLRSTVRSLAATGEGPAALLAKLNDQLATEADARMVTVFYAEFDTADASLRLASAGHEPPLLCRTGRVESIETRDLVVGVTSGVEYLQVERRVRPGDVLLLFTDGISEARSPQGEFFGSQGVEQVLRERIAEPPQSLANAVYSQAHRHAQGRFSDDVSLLVLKF